jgi:predicted homoserine dehydrogenase-like protein
VLKQAVPAGQIVRWQDVIFDSRNHAVSLRREMENIFRDKNAI